MDPLLVVGAGLFGSLAARLAAAAGIPVRVLDPLLPGRASPCSGGLYRPEWLASLGPLGARGVAVLDALGLPRPLTLASPKGPVAARYVPPAAVLWPEPEPATVLEIADGRVRTAAGWLAGAVYVAAGVWTARLVAACPAVAARAGAAILFDRAAPPRLELWAPYRHAVAFRRDPDATYFSDGTARAAAGYYADHRRLEQTFARARRFGLDGPCRVLEGMRPYTKGGPWFARVSPRTWAATGGAKSGTVVAAAFAERLLRELRP